MRESALRLLFYLNKRIDVIEHQLSQIKPLVAQVTQLLSQLPPDETGNVDKSNDFQLLPEKTKLFKDSPNQIEWPPNSVKFRPINQNLYDFLDVGGNSDSVRIVSGDENEFFEEPETKKQIFWQLFKPKEVAPKKPVQHHSLNENIENSDEAKNSFNTPNYTRNCRRHSFDISNRPVASIESHRTRGSSSDAAKFLSSAERMRYSKGILNSREVHSPLNNSPRITPNRSEQSPVYSKANPKG